MQLAICLLSFLLPHSLLHAASPNADEPPVVGQPLDFSGAVGSRFQVEMRASPTEVKTDDFFTLTIRITALGPWQRPPRRPDLASAKPFKERFEIQRIRSGQPDRRPDEDSWEFDYQLRPRREGAVAIPYLRFSYYNPAILWPEKRWQFTYGYGLRLKVVPVTASTPPRPIVAPPEMLQFAEGPSVLRRDGGPSSAWLVALGLLAAPAGCLCWYLVWMRLYPDAARLSRQRRSRAAQEALDALARPRKGNMGEQAGRVTAIVASYLRCRFDLSAAEPTPAETADFLEHSGCQPHLAARVADLFRASDTARFAPEFWSGRDDLAATASRLILDLEADACSAQSA